LAERPLTVSCNGIDLLKPGIHDVCNLTMHFPGNRMGMIHVSWLDPRKERVLTVVGDRKMAVYDDLEQEKIKIYDKGIVAPPASGDFADFQISYRYGGSYSPFINEREPLKAECADFIRCIADDCPPLTGGENGLAVVEVLEAANRSLSLNGAPVIVGDIGLGDGGLGETVDASVGMAIKANGMSGEGARVGGQPQPSVDLKRVAR